MKPACKLIIMNEIGNFTNRCVKNLVEIRVISLINLQI